MLPTDNFWRKEKFNNAHIQLQVMIGAHSSTEVTFRPIETLPGKKILLEKHFPSHNYKIVWSTF